MQARERIHLDEVSLAVMILPQVYATAIPATQRAPCTQCDGFNLSFERA